MKLHRERDIRVGERVGGGGDFFKDDMLGLELVCMPNRCFIKTKEDLLKTKQKRLPMQEKQSRLS